jgi:hypothetical protein
VRGNEIPQGFVVAGQRLERDVPMPPKATTPIETTAITSSGTSRRSENWQFPAPTVGDVGSLSAIMTARS